MKLSAIFFGATMAAEPMDYLNKLKSAAHEILNSDGVTPKSNKWTSNWERKFTNTVGRMARNYADICGFIDIDNTPMSADLQIDTADACGGMKQVLGEMLGWSDRHLALCNGQKTYKHHEKRMAKWETKLEPYLNCDAPVDTAVDTAESPCVNSIECRDGHGLGHWMCNFDYGDAGFCEPCESYTDEQACIDTGFHEAVGTEECIKVCVNGDYGADPIAAAVAQLDGQCFYRRSGDYDFRVCPFGDVTQHHLYSSSEYFLGDWNGAQSVNAEGDALSFTGGAGPCPNGRYRSSKVNFTCGSSTRLTSASEPSMCYYEFDMTVVCDGAGSRTNGRKEFLPMISNSTVV